MDPVVDDSTIQEITKLAILCNISYLIKKTKTYISTSSDETKLFKSVSDKFKYISGSVPYVNAITTKAIDQHTLYIIIPGTQNIQDFIDDIDIDKIKPNFSKYDGMITFHKGFFKQFQDLLVGINKEITEFIREGGTNITVTGHSLGGAVASIWGYYLRTVHKLPNLRVVTFGAPFFTNDVGAAWFADNLNFTRVELERDPIVNIPIMSSVGYIHIPKNYIYMSNTITLNQTVGQKSKILSAFYVYINYICFKRLNIKYHSILEYIRYLILVSTAKTI
jgi:predicted lipase